jgi:hypothetical protein
VRRVLKEREREEGREEGRRRRGSWPDGFMMRKGSGRRRRVSTGAAEEVEWQSVEEVSL